MSKKASINVRGLNEVVDPSYRYKMEPINAVQQKGKLVITNIKEIGRNLTVQNYSDTSKEDKSQMLIEFFKKKFSTPIKCDKELSKIELKGVSADELQNAIYEFIEYFVICPTCGNPETILSKEKSNIFITCQACSHHDKIKNSNKMVSKLWDNFLKILG